MLKSHMDACEQQLLSISQVPANSGHSLHKGTPREAFIKAYLESHLPSNVAIGTGEIIDANPKPGHTRNQYDIVIYKRSYPKLDFGGGISGFLIESVIATIEVKSTLDKSEFTNAAKAAHNSKKLASNVVSIFHTGYIPPGIINLIVAYAGPVSMNTVHGWINPVYSSESIPQKALPTNGQQRIRKCADAIDAVFVLGKGFMYFDNLPFGFSNDQMRQANPSMKWIFSDTTSGNLLLLFLILQGATANIEGKWLNAIPYLSTFKVPSLQWGA
jgi:hypothetical protein